MTTAISQIISGLKMIIEQTPDLTVVGEAEDGRQAVTVSRREGPDVVLMDIRMLVLDGIEATRHIVAGSPEPPRVLILTTFELDEYVFRALQAGASGFLLKRTPPEQLTDGIRTIAAGAALLSPSVTKRLIAEFAGRPERTVNPRLSDLTDREREVLVAMAKGLTNEELAETMFISENTVKTHVRNVLTKLGVRDRVNAVVLAYQSGLMDVGMGFAVAASSHIGLPAIILSRHPAFFAEWCAFGGGVIGNTTGSGPVIEGSSPSPRARRSGYRSHNLVPSSSGRGRRPLKPETPVQIWSGLPLLLPGQGVFG